MDETGTIATTSPPAGHSILSFSPTYDGIGADEYMEWEITIDNIFATRFMCPRRKVKKCS